MLEFLFLIPAFPFAGFLILALLGGRLPKTASAAIGTGSIAVSALLTILCGIGLLIADPPVHTFIQTFGTWMSLSHYDARFSLLLDPLSLIMMLVITFVGFLIHLYSTEFMEGEEGYSRFFAYMNLFVSSMLILVLADNLVLLYLGWEGVGLCSYLLIGFWYRDERNGSAARKAFIVTRIGDTAMALGIFLLYRDLGTLDIQAVMRTATEQWSTGSPGAVLAAALLLGGAVGKSAQLPLQTWLPDAMAGPTPVSALIHAATMVTAGVYLIARTHVLFELAPPVQLAVALIGTATLLIAGFSALTQKDIKRVLAYSTISQIGYMFLALGLGAWTAAMFHFMTHAFFKALLFLGAGVVILAQNHEHDMFRMGGLRNRIPLVFWTFLAGAASLSALPLISAGFYSKDRILSEALFSHTGGAWFWAAGVIGAFLTALYTFRMVFITFFGRAGLEVSRTAGMRMKIPLVLLAVLSLTAGFIELPEIFGKVRIFSNFLDPVFGLPARVVQHGPELASLAASSLLSLAGIAVAYVFFLRKPGYIENLFQKPLAGTLHRFWLSGWGFDRLYSAFMVEPFLLFARLNKHDVVDSWYSFIAAFTRGLHYLLSWTQTGNIRLYAMAIAAGAAAFIGILIAFQ